MVSQLNLALWAWLESLRDLRRGRLWIPFLALALAQGTFVLLLTQFHRPFFSWLLAPLVKALGGPASLHYPDFYLLLGSWEASRSERRSS
jgi:hypothetical protein